MVILLVLERYFKNCTWQIPKTPNGSWRSRLKPIFFCTAGSPRLQISYILEDR